MYVYNLFVYILRHDKGINPKKKKKRKYTVNFIGLFFYFFDDVASRNLKMWLALLCFHLTAWV